MRISDWSSDVCSFRSDHFRRTARAHDVAQLDRRDVAVSVRGHPAAHGRVERHVRLLEQDLAGLQDGHLHRHHLETVGGNLQLGRSEEHTSELQSLMRISYAVFCLKKKITNTPTRNKAQIHNDNYKAV